MRCSNSEKITTGNITEDSQADSLFASLERTACYGKCPTYKISVFQSGYVLYEGKNFTDNIGEFYSQVDEGVIEKIKTMADEINFFSLDSLYDPEVTDLPKAITSVNKDGNTKTITRRLIGPDKLKRYEEDFDALFSDTKWILIEVEE